MSKKQVGLIALCASVFILVVIFKISRVAAQTAATGATNRTPFTVIVREIQTNHGKQTDDRISTESILSDGSLIHVANSRNGQTLGWRSMLDLQNRKRIVLDVATKSVTTYPMSNSEYINATKVLVCSGQDSGAILGYKVIKTSEIQGKGPFWTKVESLLAPALNCYPMSVSKDLVDSNGAILGHSQTTVTEILLGDMSRSELAVPSDYNERPPSQVRALQAALEGRQCTECELSGNSMLDDAYNSHRK